MTRVSGIDLDPFVEQQSLELGNLRVIGQVVIAKPFDGVCAAERCMNIEGIVAETRQLQPSRNYGENPEAYAGILVEMWQRGSSFVNLEHDIAPWPGAIEELFDCEKPLCCYAYPTWPRGRQTIGIGCMKFGQAVIEKIPQSWEDWGACAWWDLDGAMISDIKAAEFIPHIHLPSVAHVRRPMGAVQ